MKCKRAGWYDMLKKKKERAMKLTDEGFDELIRDVISTAEFIGTKQHRHHIKSNVYDHSIKVAWLCYRHCKRYGIDVNLREVVRGALLHDLYLYDRHDRHPSHRHHGTRHPRRALENARRIYADLSETECDIILHHMFPLTWPAPRTREGRLVCFYDKLAAIGDYFGKDRWREQKKNGGAPK